jgi:thymidylate synthase
MKGNIPVLMVEGEGLAETWERSLIEAYREGCEIKTEYDKPDDPPSKDCSMTMVIRNPLAEPMIHRDMPGGLEDLQEYVMEVLDGIKDHCVRNTAEDPEDTRWEYTYHQRLFAYSVPKLDEGFDQIALLAKKLAATPHTRRAQAITWKVWEDNDCYDPACLQSISTEHLVQIGAGGRCLVSEHQHQISLQRCLQGGLDEHVCVHPASEEDCHPGFRPLGT